VKILIINGPNINMIGIREPKIYGKKSYKELTKVMCEYANEKRNLTLETYQSNHEGDIVDKIQYAFFNKFDGILINPAAYTHTSIAIADAIKAVGIPTVEVHLSDISMREEYRQISYVSEVAVKTIMGKGFDGYIEGIEYLLTKKWTI
jgi:3-dehydroquinate dehydratase-2